MRNIYSFEKEGEIVEKKVLVFCWHATRSYQNGSCLQRIEVEERF